MASPRYIGAGSTGRAGSRSGSVQQSFIRRRDPNTGGVLKPRAILLLLLVDLGSLLAATAHGQPTLPSPPELRAELAAVRARFLGAAHDERLEDLSALFAEDAAMVPGGAGRISGRPAILQLWERIFKLYSSETTFTPVRVEGSAELAYESGDFAETSVALADGSRREVQGTYLMIFRRAGEGGCKILELVLVERAVPKGPAPKS